MNSKEYVIWLKGFVEACHEYAPTPKQWDALKDKLTEVNDEDSVKLLKDYVNPYGHWKTTSTLVNSTHTEPYTTGGEDEIVKHHNED